MMLKGVHFILSYTCNSECDHCFVYSGPTVKGTFTLRQVKAAIEEMKRIESVEWVYFEGGEPFMFYPLMVEGLRLARDAGFKLGIVTNSYWATTEENAELWLKPLLELGVSDLSVSDDAFHYENEENPSKNALRAAKRLGIPVGTIRINMPTKLEMLINKGRPILRGGALLKGRAAETLAEKLPKRRYDRFTECTAENLREPGRVHIDPYGNVQVCQGISIGNMWETPLSTLDAEYDPERHPIIGPLLEGGPVLLAKRYGVKHEKGYASECHFCYMVRLALLDRFPRHLAPRQVYGSEG